jgi:uncharacterized membrane-anchored protein
MMPNEQRTTDNGQKFFFAFILELVIVFFMWLFIKAALASFLPQSALSTVLSPKNPISIFVSSVYGNEKARTFLFRLVDD